MKLHLQNGTENHSGSTVTVLISGDSIKIINNESLSGKKGQIIEHGKIVKHKSTGQWIIATKPRR